MKNLLLDAAETSGDFRPASQTIAIREIRAAVHVACWIPFITAAANSWFGPWRAVGDGARLALVSWDTLSGSIPLVGRPNELPHAPHDLGPLQYWLLTIPVHADTARGVFWGAVLLVVLATSLTVEAAYAARGEMGGLLAAGVVIALVAWFPSFASYPFDNPNFGTMFFVAALAACLTVLSGHRKWWPVLVVTASIAAQAYLTFAAASVGLVFIALVAGLADEFRAKNRYSWLITGLVAGAACWIAPLDQQFTSPAGQGNMSLLLHEDGGQHVGIAFAMKVIASLAAPSPLWWKQDIGQRNDLYQVLGSKPAALGFMILIITAASLIVTVFWLRSRELAGLAAITLLVSVTAAATFARIPAQSPALGLPSGQLRGHDLAVHIGGAHLPHDVPLIFVMCGERAPGGQQRARKFRIRLLVRVTAALFVVTTALLSAAQLAADYRGAGTNNLRVNAALAMIERSWPKRAVIALSVARAPRPDPYQVLQGLCWALTADGYRPFTYQPEVPQSRRNGTLPEATVLIRGRKMTVMIGHTPRKNQTSWHSCNGG